MPKVRKSHPPSLKAKVAVEAIKAHKTAAQIAQMVGVQPAAPSKNGRFFVQPMESTSSTCQGRSLQ
jgi:hypothetical protein